MELGLGNTLLPGDSRLIDHIVAEVKSQGIFDQFRKECIADVDTKPAYQNLNARVESSVNSFLSKQKWRADLNKNQLRETLRKHIHDAPYLEVGVDRIVDQVVNPKVYSVFMPKIEDVVYKYLGIERPKPQKNGACDLKDLLPTDLDPVSPESDKVSIKDENMELVDESEKEIVDGNEQKPDISTVESKSLNMSVSSIKKENTEIENEKDSQAMDTSPVKIVLNTSSKAEETMKMEEEDIESPAFEPIDIMNLNESNMSNDSHLSGISGLTSHRSATPDFTTEFARDNFDCSNQDSQLSKVSSNSRLSIVTDIGSSNHGSTPKSDAKEDSKSIKDNLKAAKEFDSSKDNKFNFDVAKMKENSKTSSSSKESSRDASDSKDGKSKDESRGKSSKVKHVSRSSRDQDRDSRRRHSSKKRHRSRSKDKTESDSQESKENCQKSKESKSKEIDKKEETSDEVTDLKDRYKEKIRELREKIETEKGKLGKTNSDSSKDKKDSVSSKDREESKKSGHKSSRSASHRSKSSARSESRDKSSGRHDERRHNAGKSESKSSSRSKRDSKLDSRSRDRSKDRKRRDEKKSKSTDDHSSLRKNLNDRRSSDRDGSDGSNSKYSHKTSFSTNNASSKIGLASELTKDNKEQHSSSETENVHDTLQTMFKGNDGLSTKVNPGSSEIYLPLKKRRLLSEESQNDGPSRKRRSTDNKSLKRKHEQLDTFKTDGDIASVPDEERVQIVEYADEEYDQPYPDKELILSLEETKKIILDAEPMPPPQPNLSEMEQSIRQSLTEMMTDHKMSEVEDVEPVKVSTVMDSSSLLEALTDDSSTDKEAFAATNTEDTSLDSKAADFGQSDANNEANRQESVDKFDESKRSDLTVEHIRNEENTNVCESNKEQTTNVKADLSIENQLKQFESLRDEVGKCNTRDLDLKVSPFTENTDRNNPEIEKFNEIAKEPSTDTKEVQEKVISKIEKSNEIAKEPSIEASEEMCVSEIQQSNTIEKEPSIEETESNIDDVRRVDTEPDTQKDTYETELDEENQANSEEDTLVIDEDAVDEKENDNVEATEITESSEKNSNDEGPPNQVGIVQTIAKDKLADVENNTDDTLDNTSAKQVNNENVEKLNEPENIVKSPIKLSEFTKEVKEKGNNQLIDELTKFDENGSVDDIEESISDQCKNDVPMDIIKLDDSPAAKSVDAAKLNSDDESDIDIVEIKDYDEVANDVYKRTEGKFDEFDPLTEDSMDVEKPEGKNVVENVNFAENCKEPAVNVETLSDSLDQKSTKEVDCAIGDGTASPVEEDCRYFDDDNEKYLSFKKYLDRLEANNVTGEQIENPVVEVHSVVEPTDSSDTILDSLKRKQSPSCIVDNVVQNHSNDELTTMEERVDMEVTNQEFAFEETLIPVVKKRKVGRMKKSNSSSSVTSSSSQTEQSQDREQREQQQQQQQQQQHHQQHHQQHQQQAQAAIVNGESLTVPHSPESDISVSSDKNLGGKDEKRGQQRSNQRYSSDDLYKPRPLFSSSSRRTRRYHKA